jgi:exoribonuclease-2
MTASAMNLLPMTVQDLRPPRVILQDLARRAMLARGLEPDFPPAALAEVGTLRGPAESVGMPTRDLRDLPWCSIDNDDSRDLDQLSVAEQLPGGATKILVAIADVSALVRRDSALDQHARKNTTSVYTAAQIFPMLPERLSTDLTSLNLNGDRVVIVVEMVFAADGSLQRSDIFSAMVRNQAKLAYRSVAAWLDGETATPAAIAAVPGLDENIRLQDRVTQQVRALRHVHGALSFETIEARPAFVGEALKEIEEVKPDRAKNLIADLMIAANGVTARYLARENLSSLRRVVRSPERWDRIAEIALAHGTTLPAEPDVKALERFLLAAKSADPAGFPELSLSVIKLLGAGEYVLERPSEPGAGHFGLAVRDYAHSTAPNRRFPDLITQRLIRASLAGEPSPYSDAELAELATHCTKQEDAARKVERQVGKSAATLVLQSRIGEVFDAIVTGSSDKGTWVRLVHPPVEGKLDGWGVRPKVGDRLRVELVHTDFERGFIDFRISR